MKIVVVEDDSIKRDEVIGLLNADNIEFEVFEYINLALRYIIVNKDNISGIILDLGLASMPGAHDATSYKGLELVNELNRKKIDIPILINSSTEVDMIESYPSVFGQKHDMYDSDILEYFVSFLRRRERQ